MKSGKIKNGCTQSTFHSSFAMKNVVNGTSLTPQQQQQQHQ